MKHYLPMTGLFVLFVSSFSFASGKYLIKFRSADPDVQVDFVRVYGGSLEPVSLAGRLYAWSGHGNLTVDITNDPEIEYIQKNHPIHLIDNPSLVSVRAQLNASVDKSTFEKRGPAYPDNPEIAKPSSEKVGSDPLLTQSWGLFTVAANQAWNKTPQGQDIIVAITDTGVDYNHPDLITNMWRNSQGLVGWDFVGKDNKPYDLSMSIGDILFSGGNPGHGTHCAGVAAARLNNTLGTAGVAPKARIMALRFINESGRGDTADAIKAIDFAIENGAKIISASWGSEGEEEKDMALREAIMRANEKGVLFIAAAGNGRLDPQTFVAKGYDNDSDAKPMYPATYPYENIITVAALGSDEKLASFSNWGKKSVDLGAPGVKILSTVPGARYQDTIIDLGQMKVTWDGTSMATPFVAGAAAVVWSQSPNWNMKKVKETLLSSTVNLDQLQDKVVTAGRLDLSHAGD
ncbi:MAG: S8 family serine peptidase [Deltaproteobacteria bacterium]|nr:S8 family serine peptidase [Deltaproteobacteria bacterium]